MCFSLFTAKENFRLLRYTWFFCMISQLANPTSEFIRAMAKSHSPVRVRSPRTTCSLPRALAFPWLCWCSLCNWGYHCYFRYCLFKVSPAGRNSLRRWNVFQLSQTLYVSIAPCWVPKFCIKFYSFSSRPQIDSQMHVMTFKCLVSTWLISSQNYIT